MDIIRPARRNYSEYVELTKAAGWCNAAWRPIALRARIRGRPLGARRKGSALLSRNIKWISGE
jgi:hypothetical protein